MSQSQKKEGPISLESLGFTPVSKHRAELLPMGGEANNFGTNNFDAKREVIDKLDDDLFTVDNVKELGSVLKKFVTSDVPRGARATLESVRWGLTPSFIKRLNQRKIHVQYLEDTDKKLESLQAKNNEEMAAELKYYNTQKETDKMVKELLKQREHIREEVRENLQAAKMDQVEEEFKAFHKRRAAQLAEAEAKLAQEREDQLQKEEADAQSLRDWRVQFFSDQAEAFKAEVAALNPDKVRREKYEGQLDRVREEWDSREKARTRMQVEMPLRSAKVGLDEDLGIFAPARPADDEELLLEELDAHDMHVFDAPPHTGTEQLDMERRDLMSALQREEDLYSALQVDAKELKDAISRMDDMLDVLEKEQRQINQELLAIEKTQQGPPRRLPNTEEIPSTHLWKQRAAFTLQRLKDLEHTKEKAQQRRRDMLEQSNSVAKNIVMLKEQCEQKEKELSEVNGGLGNLPMIVGVNISKAPGLGDAFAKPKEMLNAITHKSKLAVYRAESEVALQLRKESNNQDRELWAERLHETGTKADLESMISRITEIADRLKRSKVDAMRLNIIDSLKAFLASGLTLHPIRKKLVGMLPWYKHHDYQLSANIVPFRTNNIMGAITFEASADDQEIVDEAYANGVSLGEFFTGYCTGSVALPRDTVWTISLTIARQGHTEEFAHVDESDFVAVKIGPTVRGLSPVGTFFNKINPATGAVLYDVKHVFRGNTFSFRFDFSSTTKDAKKHLAVCTGIYEEFELPDLEVVSDPQNLTKTRVLSSFVKMIRFEEARGKLRETRLLEELIAAEHSNTLHWDSQILSQYLQRFSREYFLRILKAEILLQQGNQHFQRIKEEQEQQQRRALLADADLKKEVALEQSRKKYMMKKRAFQRKFIDDSRDLVNKRLLLWDESEHKWRNVVPEECTVEWIDNGLQAKVRHIIQEYDDGHEKIGRPFEVDLSQYKYFQSPIQKLDENAIAKMREKKAWMDRIHQIRDDLKARIERANNSFDKHKKKSLRDLQRAQERIQEMFDKSIEEKAKTIAALPAAKKKIKSLVPAVLLDMRKGVVLIDEKQTRKQQAKKVAYDRFVQEWIAERRQDLKRKFEEMEANVSEELEERTRSLREHCRKITASAEREIQTYKEMIRHQYLVTRKALLEQAKFPKEVFRQVVPVSFQCEHLRTKCWGDLYSKGVRCLVCGKELSNLHEEESQVLGIGSGTSRELWEAVNRHRSDETSFRFSSNAELQLVENERIRLEKERRVMQEDESYFYDYQDLQVIYEFDARHAREIKQNGVFRQGLQWTKEELDHFQLQQTIRQKERLEAQGLPETLLEDFDPLAEVDDPPPTFRAADERRRAQYRDFLYSIGRLHNFRRRIMAHRARRVELMLEREIYVSVLDTLHRESYALETQLQDLEADLDRSSKLLSTFESMQRLWQQASLITTQARKDVKKAEMARVGVWDDVKEAQEKATFVHDEMKSLLKTKLVTESKLAALQSVLGFKEKQLTDRAKALEEKQRLVYAMKFVMPGNFVTTRYGQCFVLSYRERDDMVLVSLPFGKPPAKAYIYFKDIVESERALQESESLLMAQEDENMRKFVFEERAIVRRERLLMQKDEERVRSYYEFVDLNKNQRQQHFDAVTAAVQESYAITQTRKYHAMQEKTVRAQLQKAKDERQRRRSAYVGPASGRPAAMSFWETRRQRKAIVAQLREQFVLRQAKEAEQRVERDILAVRSEWIQTYFFNEMIDGVLREMIYELCHEAHSEGKQAKHLAERKTGIFFPTPTHMQYDTYNLLAGQWQRRKDELRRDIELNRGEVGKILAAIEKERAAKNNTQISTEGREEDLVASRSPKNNTDDENAHDAAPSKAKEQALLEETRKRREKKRLRKLELQRQQRLCEEMQREENRCRAFYYWEMKENLRERRLMREEDRVSAIIRQEELRLRKEAEQAFLLKSKNRNASMASTGGATINGNNSVTGAGSAVQLNAGLSAEILAKRDLQLTYERRRQELKELTLERRRRAEDQQMMIVEDELSHQLREIDRIERQRKAFVDEFGEDEDEEGKEEDKGEVEDIEGVDEDAGKGENNGRISRKDEQQSKRDQKAKKKPKSDVDYEMSSLEMELLINKMPFPVPEWLTVPKGFVEWTQLAQNKFIRTHVLVRHKQRLIEKKAEREAKRLAKMEEKSFKAWQRRFLVLEQFAREAELATMEATEELHDCEAKLHDLEENINKVNIFCREKGEQELKIRSELTRLRNIATQRDEELKEAEEWLALCVRRGKNRDKLKRRVSSQCKWIDTDSINGFHQRFATELLRERIYATYFRNIVQSIVNRAEIIASERKLFTLQYELSLNKVQLQNRSKGMNHVLREIRCQEFMRMRRSALNERFFPKNRKNILLQRFRGWQRFYLWNRGNKDAFKLKYEIIKRQLEIDRQFREQLQRKNGDAKAIREVGNHNLDSRQNPLLPTLMARVRERPVQCQHCFSFYIASQNQSLACAYHPAEFKLQCPPSCPQPGLTAKCNAHRMRRYACCNQTSSRAPGCSRRYHAPPPSDPVYDLIMDKINKRDEEFLTKLDADVEMARQEEWPRKAQEIKRLQLLAIEEELEDAREVVSRYDLLKLV